MPRDEALIQALKRLLPQEAQVYPANVTAVNDSETAVDVQPLDGPELFDVRLRAGLTGQTSGWQAVPAVDSTVLVAQIGNDASTAYVAQCSEITKYRMEIGYLSYELTEDGMKLNGEDYTVLKGAELLSEIGKLNDQVKALLQIIQGPPVPEPGNGSPSALQTALKGAVAAKQPGQFGSDLENEKVKHG